MSTDLSSLQPVKLTRQRAYTCHPLTEVDSIHEQQKEDNSYNTDIWKPYIEHLIKEFNDGRNKNNE
jgi:hypothetical protein